MALYLPDDENKLSGIILYDYKQGISYQVGFGCDHISDYDLSDKDKEWFETIVNLNGGADTSNPICSVYFPPNIESIAMPVIHYLNYALLLVVKFTDCKVAEEICSVACKQINWIFDRMRDGEFEVSDLKLLNVENEIAECKDCVSEKTCIPKYSMEIDYM
ncbi:MAG: hypothetical protein ACXAD7_13110 [Candidatus Kariarchaeaceae archaeon]|jgi:hypothetical protein